jgi:hypothetical protein
MGPIGRTYVACCTRQIWPPYDSVFTVNAVDEVLVTETATTKIRLEAAPTLTLNVVVVALPSNPFVHAVGCVICALTEPVKNKLAITNAVVSTKWFRKIFFITEFFYH